MSEQTEDFWVVSVQMAYPEGTQCHTFEERGFELAVATADKYRKSAKTIWVGIEGPLKLEDLPSQNFDEV